MLFLYVRSKSIILDRTQRKETAKEHKYQEVMIIEASLVTLKHNSSQKWIMSSDRISPSCMKCFIQFREQMKTSYCIKYNLYFSKARMLSFSNIMFNLFLTYLSKEYFYSFIAISHCQVKESDWFCPSFKLRPAMGALWAYRFTDLGEGAQCRSKHLWLRAGVWCHKTKKLHFFFFCRKGL